MRAYLVASLVSLSLSACAGLDIKPISSGDEAASRSGQKNLSGYVVYQPMVVVEVTPKEICSKDNEGKCTTSLKIICSAGAPFTLPDLSKPFLVNVRSGFGKAGVDVAIANGWQLGNIKDNSDNTAILGAIKELADIKIAVASEGTCKAPGLYRVNLTAKGVELTPLLVY